MSNELPPPPYLEVFVADDGFDVWHVGEEQSAHEATFDTLDELIAALTRRRLPIVADGQQLATTLRARGLDAQHYQ